LETGERIRVRESNLEDVDDHACPPDAIRLGGLVEIHDLRGKPELNGQLAVALVEVEDRLAVALARGSGVRVKPINLRLPSFLRDGGIQAHKVVACWPTENVLARPADVLVSPVPDWPSTEQWEDECTFLRDRWSWSEPRVLRGLMRRGHYEQEFVMLYDAQDFASPTNNVATRMSQLALHKEVVTGKKDAPHGVCMLMYAPQKAYVTSSNALNVSADALAKDRRWSLHEFREIIHFHTTAAAAEQYRKAQSDSQSADGMDISIPM
jgi:hypothetical protein